jgi:hypothetical protein
MLTAYGSAVLNSNEAASGVDVPSLSTNSICIASVMA